LLKDIGFELIDWVSSYCLFVVKRLKNGV